MPFLAYASDRQDAAASGPAFARGFLKLTDFLRGSTPQEACDQRVHLVAHSMGNYVLRHAVQEIVARSPGRATRIFDQVFLMAADEDADAFEHDHKLKPLPSLAKRVSVYFNNEDRAIALSDKTKGNPDRLDDDGPQAPRGIPGKVTLVDSTPVVEGLVEHSYFLDRSHRRRGHAKGSRRHTVGRDHRPRLRAGNEPVSPQVRPGLMRICAGENSIRLESRSIPAEWNHLLYYQYVRADSRASMGSQSDPYERDLLYAGASWLSSDMASANASSVRRTSSSVWADDM